MKTISFELTANTPVFYPDGPLQEKLKPAITAAFPVTFALTCNGPQNSWQMNSSMDDALIANFIAKGQKHALLNLPDDVSKRADFVTTIAGDTVVFEIEKANWEKIFYDFLKFHIYFAAGAQSAVMLAPCGWAHQAGEKDVFHIACERYDQALKYGMGTREQFGRILIVGFRQFFDGQPYDANQRNAFRKECEKVFPKK